MARQPLPHWQNRITRTAEVSPKKLTPNPSNWRRHPKHQHDQLLAVIAEVGWVQDIIVNETTGNLLDGHLRLELALEAKQKTVPVKYVQVTEDEERLILATLDPLAALASTDSAALQALLSSIETDNKALADLLQGIADREDRARDPAPPRSDRRTARRSLPHRDPCPCRSLVARVHPVRPGPDRQDVPRGTAHRSGDAHRLACLVSLRAPLAAVLL